MIKKCAYVDWRPGSTSPWPGGCVRH